MRRAGRMERGGSRRRAVAALSLLGVWLAFAVPAVGAPDPEAATPTEIAESVTVRLGQVQVLVTDKRGAPITDLRQDEIRVRERGATCRIAALEPFATGDLTAAVTAAPVPLFTASGRRLQEPPEDDSKPWAAPAAVRHVVLLFDAYNSRTPDRQRWIDAARGWVQDEMRPNDRVALAVMRRAQVELVVPFKDDRATLLGYLTGESLVAGGTYYDSMNEMRGLLDSLQTCVSAYEPDMCAISASQSYLFEWRTRTNQTVGALRRFAASLGAIPGRKSIFYMSDGLVVNPGEVATQAVLATLGSDVVPYNRMSSTLAQDAHFDVLEAMRVARIAGVTFFTFDTRHSSMRDVSWMAEERVAMNERMVSDPFAVMFDETRASLDTMSIETGGRSYHGPSIEDNLPRAISAIEGLYTVVYYREPDADDTPKVRIKVERKGARVTYFREPRSNARLPSAAQLELGVATPQRLADELVLPLVIQIPARQLTFTEDDQSMIADAALYGEALGRDGTRVADVFEVVQVTMTGKEHRAMNPDARFTHTLYLAVPAGSYRLRVRYSDPEFRFGAERAVDVTLGADGTLAGVDPQN